MGIQTGYSTTHAFPPVEENIYLYIYFVTIDHHFKGIHKPRTVHVREHISWFALLEAFLFQRKTENKIKPLACLALPQLWLATWKILCSCFNLPHT